VPNPVMWNGVPILKANGAPALGQPCCCGNFGECCCLGKYDAVGEVPASNLTVTISGAIAGTGTLLRITDEDGFCGTWEVQNLALSTTCGDILTITIRLECPVGETTTDALIITVTSTAASCQVVAVAAPVHPDAGGTCDPLDVTATDGWTVEDILEDCACDPPGQFITIQITFP
jgi:hypothetical protein